VKVLIVDNNKEIREMLHFYCKSIKVYCMVVNDGKDGLEVIRKKMSLILSYLV
jgi:CheY-like chemotaxis protein